MMIIECAQCHSKFRLDEGSLKAGGSKVRCSLCKNVFTAYPQITVKPVEKRPPEKVLEVDDRMRAEPIGQIMEGISPDELVQRAEREEAFEAISPEDLTELQKVKTVVMDMSVEPEEELEIPEEELPGEAIEKKKGEKKKPSRSPVLMIVLLCIVLLLGGAVAVFMLAPELVPISLPGFKTETKSDVTDMGVSKLFFRAVNGAFFQTTEGKQRFVVTGEVINNFPSSRSFILLMGSILDNKGQVLKRMSVYAGNTFTEVQIKELPVEELHKWTKNRFGRERINFNVKPGGAVPFMIIFEDLPENMSEFTVEGVSSIPGK
ncbi:MAG: DUF3426 domain-containing protein [Pseudomonadota bacterium]